MNEYICLYFYPKRNFQLVFFPGRHAEPSLPFVPLHLLITLFERENVARNLYVRPKQNKVKYNKLNSYKLNKSNICL